MFRKKKKVQRKKLKNKKARSRRAKPQKGRKKNDDTSQTFKKIKNALQNLNSKLITPPNYRQKTEHDFENHIWVALNLTLGKRLGKQIKRRAGIVDLKMGKVGIEVKLNKRGVKTIIGRLLDQAGRYNALYKKLIILVVNLPRESGETKTTVRNTITNRILEILNPRDFAVIVKDVK